ncbi:MAG: succinylglutamate-semialdehyde dehydrogenase [Tepidisphaerales bacterium]
MNAGPVIVSRSPADGRPLGSFPVAGPADVHLAVTRARATLRAWSAHREQRVRVVEALAETLRRREFDVATLIAFETGKPMWEARTEVAAMVNKCTLSIRSETERRAPSHSAAGAVTYRPHGVVAVLGPFNFPGHLPLGHIAPALLAGNAVVFKPSEKAPAVGQRLAELFAEAGLPENVLHVLHGGADTAAALIDADIDAVLFTGSYATGCRILQRLVHRPGVLTALEMGGNNPMLAWDVPESSVPAAAVCVVQSAFITAGQRCSCTRRLIVPKGHPLISAVVETARTVRVGLPDDTPPPFYGCVIDDAAAQRVLTRQQFLAEQGELLLAARPLAGHPRLLTPGIVRCPTPQDLNTPPDESTDTEVFGPLLQVIEADHLEQAFDIANHTHYGLAAGLLSADREVWERFRVRVRAGVLTWNRPTTGSSSELPFGGIKRSGNHRPSAYFAADYCSYAVAEMAAATLRMPATLPPGLCGG